MGESQELNLGHMTHLAKSGNVTSRVTAAEDTPSFRSAANEPATSGSSLTGGNVTARVTATKDTSSFRSAANEPATSGSSLTGDFIHAVTSVSRYHKRMREDVRPMLVPSKNIPLKRTRGSTGTGRVCLLRCAISCVVSFLRSLAYSEMLNAGNSPVYDDLGD
ncbi:hypothetical protein Tco_1314035 [Tanacetum coccineum]